MGGTISQSMARDEQVTSLIGLLCQCRVGLRVICVADRIICTFLQTPPPVSEYIRTTCPSQRPKRPPLILFDSEEGCSVCLQSD